MVGYARPHPCTRDIRLMGLAPLPVAWYSAVVLALTLAACGSSGQTTSSVHRTAKTDSPAGQAARGETGVPSAVLAARRRPGSGDRRAPRWQVRVARRHRRGRYIDGQRHCGRSPRSAAQREPAKRAARCPGRGASGQVYVFGGGQFSQYDHILRFDPASGSVTTAGSLPSAESDVAVTQLGGTAYIVGGFDGTNSLDTIVAWTPGGRARVVAHLPVALRYAAVASAGGALLIIGGSTPTGASDVVYRFDPASATVRQLGRMPQPITHAGAAAIGQTVYVVGGRGDSLDARSAAVWAIDPLTGRVRSAGRLPQPISDAGVVSLGNAIVVAGGKTAAGTQSGVGELVPVS